jgi:DNA-binding CsgD family transcriptional regulator
VITFAGTWEIGFTLADPVRLAEPRLAGPVAFLAEVVSNLEAVYPGKRVLRYMNPEHPKNDVEVRADAVPAKLRDLAGSWRAKGGRSRSEAKVLAALGNLAAVNQARADAGSERAERFRHLKAGGLTLAEIAAREGVTVNAVKCAMRRARRIDASEAAELERRQADWQALLAAREAERARFTSEQRRLLDLYAGRPYTVHHDGTLEIQVGEDSVCRVDRAV